MRRLGILIFSEPTYPKHPGGAGKCAHLYAAALAHRGHAVRIVCPGSIPEIENIDGVEVHRVPLEGKPPRPGTRTEENGTAAGLLRYVLTNVPIQSVDVILDIGGFLSYFYLVEYELRRRFGIPLVTFFQLLHDHVSRDPERYIDCASQHPSEPFPDWHKERPQCFAVRISDAVICLTQDEASVVERLYRPRRIHVLPNPIDPRLLNATIDRGFRDHVARPRERLLLFAGRFEDHTKGRDIVKRAFQRVAAQRRDVRLMLMGNTDDGYFRSLGSKIIDLGWVRDVDKIASVFSAADLFLMPSRYEPFGMLCAEAMAMGVPVVASPVGGLKEMVRDRENGISLQGVQASKWPRQMADGILELLADAGQLAQLGRNAMQSARTRFAVDLLAGQLDQILCEAIDRNSGLRVRAIEPPALDATDHQHYRQLLGAAAPEAAKSAELLLPRFLDKPETRCLACSRCGLAASAWRLHALSRPAQRRDARWRPRFRRAIFAACPLGLLQLRELEQMAAESGLMSRWQIRLTKARAWAQNSIFTPLPQACRRAWMHTVSLLR